MKRLLLSVLISLIIGGCAGSKRSGSTEASSMKDVPQFFLKVPQAENTVYGVGSAKKQNPSLTKKVATARAREEIAQSVKIKVGTMLNDFMDESGVGDNASAQEFSESITEQVSSVSLGGSKIVEVYPAKDGTIYVLVEYSLDTVRKSALDEVKKHEAMFNEFKARKGFDALKKAVSSIK